MSDIVERLLLVREYHSMMYEQYDTVTEAAAEITRLQAELAEAQALVRSASETSQKHLGLYLDAQDRLAEARDEIQRLIESIWRAEYRHDAPNWKPLPDLVGMISQMDNMYAGVRSQRDQARWEKAEARDKAFDEALKVIGERQEFYTRKCEKERERQNYEQIIALGDIVIALNIAETNIRALKSPKPPIL